MIDDSWWTGCIESRTALSAEFPTSLFMCFRTRWDNGEFEAMSPWDMEPIDQNRLPEEVGGQVAVQAEELRATLYQPKSEEWPRGDRDASRTCRRIVAGLEEVMGLAIVDAFLVPVDLNSYPSYAFMVEYPIDLTTIKARFENHFYRRLTSAQFDVRYLATNAEKFNQSNNSIVKHARIIMDLCLRIIKDQNEVDVGAVYHQLMDTYVTSDSDSDTDVGGRAGGSSATQRPSTSTAAAATTSSSAAAARRATRSRPAEDWQTKCRDLLEMIWARDDSTPFREPVDLIEHPDYLASVDTPMDLRTVKEDLLGGNYNTISEFVNDMRKIFSNSRHYNTNKRSRIYTMTLRLSNLFEAQLKAFTGKSGKRRPPAAAQRPNTSRSSVSAERTVAPASSRRRRPVASAVTSAVAGSSNGAGPSGHHHSNHNNQYHHPTHSRVRIRHDTDDSDDDEEVDILSPSYWRGSSSNASAATNNVAASTSRVTADPHAAGPSGTSAARSSRRHGVTATTNGTAGGSSASAALAHSGAAGTSRTPAAVNTRRTQRQSHQQQRGSRGNRRSAHRNADHYDDEEEEAEEEEDDDDDDDSDSSASSSASSEHSVHHRNRKRKRAAHTIASDASHSGGDSEESYNPTASRKKPKESTANAVDATRPTQNGRAAGTSGLSAAGGVLPSGLSTVTRRKNNTATAAASAARPPAAATSGSEDEHDDDDDDEYNAHEEEEDDDEEDDANDEDYNVSTTPKKSTTVRSAAAASASARKSTAKKNAAPPAGDPLLSSGSDDNGRRRSARKPTQCHDSDHASVATATAPSLCRSYALITLIERIPGMLSDRRTMLGELN